MLTIDIRIKDKIAMRTGGEAFIVRDNSDYVINFTFDAEWAEETAKTARFVFQGGGYIDVPFTGSIVAVPVISTGRRVDVGVFAGNLRTTTSATLPLVPSIRSKGGAPVPPKDAVYDKLIALINSMGEISDDDIKQAVEDYLSANPIAAASMRVDGGYIQYSTDNGNTWVNLIAEADLKGDKGTDGKSAYQYAVESGYTGTETEFAAKLAEEIPTVDSTLTQSGKAADAKAVGDALAGKQDTLIQSGASVGQIVKISAVDDTGKPTAWEAMNIPEQAQSDWNQNDNTQPSYVKNRPFYNETKTVTVENVTDAKLEGFPAFTTGETVTVNVDGVDHSLVAYYDENEGVFTIGDIYSDLEAGKGQLGWQFYSDGKSYTYFYATEAHTVSYLGVFIYKIDNKFVNFDGLVRTFDYHFEVEWLYKTLYNSAGDECKLYTCSNFILPDPDSQLFGFMNEFGFSEVDSVDLYSCFITGFIITPNAVVRIARVVLGTDTSHMETMAADNGYTYTKKPNT